MPQLADAHQVMTQINRKKAIRYIVLTPNQRGYDGAITADADEIAILRLQPKPSARKILTAVLKKVWHALSLCWHKHARNLPIGGYISCVVGCPYEGDVAPEAVTYIADWMLARGCYEISLGDTIDVARPRPYQPCWTGLPQIFLLNCWAAIIMTQMAARLRMS